jgi:hypothetical protein
MKKRIRWETRSLEWIHKVREEIDKEIRKEGKTPAQWVKSRGKIDINLLCQKLGLKKVKIIEGKGLRYLEGRS